MIFTFYSYKGGVGRSMALANVAEWLRVEGAHVVMIDWDLEAPGLENYFFSGKADLDEARRWPGLLDLLLVYRQHFERTARLHPGQSGNEIAEEAIRSLPNLRDFLQPIHSSGDEGSLWLISAGSRIDSRERSGAPPPPPAEDVGLDASEYAAVLAQARKAGEAAPTGATGSGDTVAPSAQDTLSPDKYVEEMRKADSAATPIRPRTGGVGGRALTFTEYAEAVQDFAWSGFYASFEGERFFQWLREQLLNTPITGAPADAILIDSRTGVTEMSGVCTRLLADVVVSFCATNRQNLSGSLDMVRSFRRPDILQRRGGKPEVILVPSRVDDRSEQADLLAFQGQFQQAERPFPTRVFVFPEDLAVAPGALVTAPNQTFWTLMIPYMAKLSYEEALTFGASGSKAKVIPLPELQKVFTRLGAYMVLHAPDASSLRRKLGAALQREVPQLLSRVLLVYRDDAGSTAAYVRQHLARHGVPLGQDVTLTSELRGDWVRFMSASLQQARAVVYVLGAASADLPSPEVLRALRRTARRVCFVASGPVDSRLPGRIYGVERDLNALVLDILHAGTEVPAPNMAPAPPDHVVERPEIFDRLRHTLIDGARMNRVTDVVVVLCGRVGAGKTTLAGTACHTPEVDDAFPGGVLWFGAGREPRLQPELEKAHTALTGEVVRFSTEQDARRRVSERLAKGNVLIVADDVWDAEVLKRLPRPHAPHTRLIVTRDPAVGAGIVPTATIVVHDMSDHEAARLLSPDADTDPVLFVDLARRVHRWPAALGLMRGELQRLLAGGMPMVDALASLSKTIERHGVLAFDRGAAADAKIGVLLSAAIAQAGDGALDALVRIAGAPDVPPPSPHEVDGPLYDHLRSLALIEGSDGRPRLHPVVRDFLTASGWLGGDRRAATRQRAVSRSEDHRTNPDVKAAREMLHSGQVPERSGDLRMLIQRLKNARYFGYAWRLAALARQNVTVAAELGRWLPQQQALCMYKDPDVPTDVRLDRALAILDRSDPLAGTRDQETLGIVGAIHKARWEFEAQRLPLEHALTYYLRGYEIRIERDDGYTAINAAYLLDVIAHEEEVALMAAGAGVADLRGRAQQRRRQARQIRREIVDTLRPLTEAPDRPAKTRKWWFLVTLAEACFGLGVDESGDPDERWYEEARFWIREALDDDLSEWEFESTARQFARLAQLQERPDRKGDTAAARTLRVLLTDPAAAESVRTGKVGLALSGGGFRAALFHIGVLARLAELDVLRTVEVLSCVSGGSIIGAYYYLHVRKLLNVKTDAEITRGDYVDIVRSIERDFLLGVQKDIRNRLYANPLVSLRSVFDSDYTHTDRLGHLLETLIFSTATTEGRALYLDDLTIHPAGAPADFVPKLDNWRRRAKVPLLVINAATLNTGHNWQFTATWMGEPPNGATSEIDASDRFGRLYYWDAPKRYHKFRLGRAVAASAAVPGFFDPVELDGLYEGKRVRLSDGGVHDNQGIGGLLDQDCTVLLVSDGSGQLFTDATPPAGHVGVPVRANDILQARVRAAQFREVAARRRAGLLRGFMFVHLTKDLEGGEVSRVGPPEALEPPDDPSVAGASGLPKTTTAYGIPAAIQRRLARIRTDLDAFSEAEAYALILSAYRMTEYEFARVVPGVGAKAEPQKWCFLAIRSAVETPSEKSDGPSRVERVLATASRKLGKVWMLAPGVSAFSAIAMIGMVAMIVTLLGYGWSKLGTWPPLSLAPPAAVLVGAALAVAIVTGIAARKALSQIGLGLLLGTVGWILFLLYRLFLQPVYVDCGRVLRPRSLRVRLVAAAGALAAAAVLAAAAFLVDEEHRRVFQEVLKRPALHLLLLIEDVRKAFGS